MSIPQAQGYHRVVLRVIHFEEVTGRRGYFEDGVSTLSDQQLGRVPFGTGLYSETPGNYGGEFTIHHGFCDVC